MVAMVGRSPPPKAAFLSSRHRNLFDNVADDLVGIDPFDFGAGIENEAVAQDWEGELLDIVRENEIAAVQGGVGAGGGGEHVGGARGGADLE